jgi:hypothetical protein
MLPVLYNLLGVWCVHVESFVCVGTIVLNIFMVSSAVVWRIMI